jgi:hypothetical protein
MKYLYSGVLCSLESTCLSLDCVKRIGWTGGLCFAAFMITCWCVLMVTFPGLTDPKYDEWHEKTFNPIYVCSYFLWGVFNTISTIVTILGIKKILKSLQQLKRFNPSLKTNYFQLTLHALVLTLNLIPVILYCIPFKGFTNR